MTAGEKALEGKASAFVTGLMAWNAEENRRKMPWKGEKDPYRVWLSEIILQQTRVMQGLAYYQRFLTAFPTIDHLARAEEQEVYKLWEGLGYYTRCRNLLETARHISQNLKGVFPTTYADILALKGVGSYTAAAIASFAYNLPYAVLDGNVYRVLARIMGITIFVDSAEGKKLFARKARHLLPVEEAGTYNQAIMDFGATICKPVPECAACFFKQECIAFREGSQRALPVKSKSISLKTRWFHYYVLQTGEELAIWQRKNKDIWARLYEPLLLEADRQLNKNDLLTYLATAHDIHEFEIISHSAAYQQRLTHQKIHFSFIHLQLPEKRELVNALWIPTEQVHHFPFPKTLQQFLSKNL